MSSTLLGSIISAIAAFFGVLLGTALIPWLRAYAARKRAARYLAIRVVCVLDRFLEACAEAATDSGEENAEGVTQSRVSSPRAPLCPADLDWQSIDYTLMYSLMMLQTLAERAADMVRAAGEISDPPDYQQYFETRCTAMADATSHAVTSGGSIYMPSVGGQVVSGPSFDINILDTQQFYQGVLGDIPFSTVETFIDQDFDNQLLMRLLIERLDFRLKETVPNFKMNHSAGEVIGALRNHASQTSDVNGEASKFAAYIKCVSLVGENRAGSPKLLAPVSRVAEDAGKAAKPLTIRELALLDGDKLDLAKVTFKDKKAANAADATDSDEQKKEDKDFDLDKGYIDNDTTADKDIYIVRTSQEKPVPRFVLQPDCETGDAKAEVFALAFRVNAGGQINEEGLSQLPDFAPASDKQSNYVGLAHVKVTGDDRKKILVDAKVDIIFRSPEGVIKFLGAYLRACKPADEADRCRVGGLPIFDVKQGNGGNAFVSANLGVDRYYIDRGEPNNPGDERRYRRYMSVLGLIEELINLEKSSTDHPATIPVHVLP